MDNIEQLNEFPTTLQNYLTNEKMIMECEQFNDDCDCVKIRRIPLNSAISFQEMLEMEKEKLPCLKISMFEQFLVLTIITLGWVGEWIRWFGIITLL